MLKYVLRRILAFIPSLIAITLLGFMIMVSAPGDPIERMVVAAQAGGEIGTQSANQMEQKKFWSKKLGLDLPIFYLSLNSMAQSDTMYRIYDKNERASLERLTDAYGNWPAISTYYAAVSELNSAHTGFKIDSSTTFGFPLEDVKEAVNVSYFETSSLKASYSLKVIESKFEKLDELYAAPYMVVLREKLTDVKSKFRTVQETATPWKKYVPVLNYYPKNQYHRWIFGDGHWLTAKGSEFTRGVIRGDFGTSYTTKMPISEVFATKFFWSFFFTMISVVLGYLVSIPLGIKSAVLKGSKFDRITTVLLFILYSLPSFWLATLLLMTFANPDVIHLFPASGIEPVRGFSDDAGFFEIWKARIPYLILPIIAYTYSSFAFLTRTMRVSMLEIVNQDYIRTARAKGLSENTVIYKHALRNALLPIITVFANIFPIAIGGSVILEVIFTIPGMGSEIFIAIVNQNYPMIITVFTVTGMLTLVGYLVSDVLYAVVDPRISYSN
ncbi:MAG: ABC transporter permease [Flavobacteriales bacterium]|nr:ABC transporter permease [Flavobacteriales bacterium]